MRKPAPKLSAVAIICAALAALSLAAPAGAGGRNDLYIGPIEQAPIYGFPHEPKIEMFVWTQHHHDGRVTRSISAINIEDVHLRCENGHYLGGGDPIGNTDLIQVNAHGSMEIKRGSFSEPRGYGSYGEGERITIKGTVSRRRASGTLAISEYLGTVEHEEILEEPVREELGTCRSGTLHWTATLSG
jgi:hypothetical protein